MRAVSQFVKANEIQPAKIGPAVAREAVTAKAFLDLGIRGGIRVPHLHVKDLTYLLNADQRAKFSKQVIADTQAKLAAAKTIDFDQAMALQSVAQTLG